MQLPRQLADAFAETPLTNAQISDLNPAHSDAARQVGHSESAIAKIIARILEDLFIDKLHAVDQNETGLPIIAATQNMAAAA